VSFPQVKSNPYGKDRQRKPLPPHLWSEGEWLDKCRDAYVKAAEKAGGLAAVPQDNLEIFSSETLKTPLGRAKYLGAAQRGRVQGSPPEVIRALTSADLRERANESEKALLRSIENNYAWRAELRNIQKAIELQLGEAKLGKFPFSATDIYQWRGKALSALYYVGLRTKESEEIGAKIQSEVEELYRSRRGEGLRALWRTVEIVECINCRKQIHIYRDGGHPDKCDKCGMTFEKWNE